MKRVALAWGPLLAATLAASLGGGAPDRRGAASHERGTNWAATRVQLLNKSVSGSTNLFLLLPRPAAAPFGRAKSTTPPGSVSIDSRESGSSKNLKPGVYESLPYTAIVIVPGPGQDDKLAVRVPGKVDPDMPILRPEMQFIPHQPVK